MNIRIDIPDDRVDELDQHAERGFMRRKALVAMIIAEWLKNPSLPSAAARTLDGCVLTPEQMKVVWLRERVVTGWREARAGKRRRETLEAVCTKYLATAKKKHGISISRASLFGWDNRYRLHGCVGLVDMRSARRADDDSNRDLKATKRGSKRGHNTARH